MITITERFAGQQGLHLPTSGWKASIRPLKHSTLAFDRPRNWRLTWSRFFFVDVVDVGFWWIVSFALFAKLFTFGDEIWFDRYGRHFSLFKTTWKWVKNDVGRSQIGTFGFPFLIFILFLFIFYLELNCWSEQGMRAGECASYMQTEKKWREVVPIIFIYIITNCNKTKYILWEIRSYNLLFNKWLVKIK